MNAVLDHLTHTSNHLIRLFRHLKVDEDYSHILDLFLLQQSVVSLARNLTPKPPDAREAKVQPDWDEQAASLLKDRELVLAIADLSPRPHSITYLYLKANSLWNEIARKDEEVAMLKHFAMALIFIAFDILSRHQGKVALEELAYKTLTADMAMREALPALRNTHDTALRQM